MILLCIVGFHTAAASDSLRNDVTFSEHVHRHYTREDGLPSNWINDILQTRDDYLWIGTDNGLVRFDGTQFRLFNTANAPQLPFDEIRTLYEDADGSIWIGTTRGAARYIPGRPSQLAHVPTLAGKLIFTFLRDRRGTLWIGTDEATYISQDGINFQPDEHAPINVRAICEDREGRLWFGSHLGLFYGDGSAYRQVIHEQLPQAAPLNESVPTRRVNAIFCDEGGDLWIGTNRTLLHMRTNGELTTCGEELSSQQIYDVIRTKNGDLYVAARFGVYRKEAEESFAMVLAEPSAFCLLEDRHGTLWVGYGDNRGLHNYHNSHRETVWGDSPVLCIHTDSEGNVWFGTSTGLCRIRNGEIEVFGVQDGLPDPRVMTITPSTAQKLWIGTAKGLVQWSPQGIVAAELPAQIATMNIGVFLEDSTGTLWFSRGTEGGFLIKDGELQELHPLNQGRIHWFWEEADGVVWVGHEQGLFLYRNDQLRRIGEHELSRLKNPRMLCHCVCPNGTLWMGTSHGIARYQSGKLEVFPPACGLEADNVERLAVDSSGEIWFGGRDGLFHARTSEFDGVAQGRLEKVTSYRVEGFDRFPPVRAFSQACLAKDGELWLAQGGLVKLQTKPFLNDHPPATVHLESIAVDDAAVSFGKHFQFASGKRRLALQFAVQPFTDHPHVQVRYRLEPYDDRWVDAGADRVAYYTDLRPGDYVFRLSTRHGNAPWMEAEQAPSFTVIPRWWETTAFRYVVASAFVGICLAYGQFRARRTHRANAVLRREIQSRKLAEEEAQRYLSQLARVLRAASMGELATSIAHEVKQPLFAILTDAETAQRLLTKEKPDIDQVRDALRVITTGGKRVTEIVDRIRSLVRQEEQPKQSIDLNEIVKIVAGFLDVELRRREINISLELAKSLPEFEGSKIELEQLLLNLILNGAQAMGRVDVAARILTVSTRVVNDTIELAVRDRGIGLKESEIERVFEAFYSTKGDGIGMGLTICRSIVRAHGGRIWATNNTDGGATFYVTFPIGRQAESFDESE